MDPKSVRSRNFRLALGVGVGVVAVGATLGYALYSSYSRNGLKLQTWEEAKDAAGRIRSFNSVLHEISEKGMEPAARPHVWPFLLEVVSPSATEEERQEVLQKLSNDFQQLVDQCQELEQELQAASAASALLGASGTARGGDMAGELVQFAEAHRIIVLDALRTDYRAAAAEMAVEAEAPGSSGRQDPWCSSTAAQALEAAGHFDGYARHQAKRLIAILTAYAVHDPETGYCQGMSDLALPFLLVLKDDSLAFWAFEGLMKRARRNFAVDESGIFAQLRALAGILEACDVALTHRLRTLGSADCHFAYRMVVVMMRREMSLDKVALLWEMSWADGLEQAARAEQSAGTTGRGQPTSATSVQWQGVDSSELSLLMLFVAAVVCSQKRSLLDDCRDNDHVLQHFAHVRVDLWGCLRKARDLRSKLQQPQPAHNIRAR